MIRRALFPVLVALLLAVFAGPAIGGSLDDDLNDIRSSIRSLTSRIDAATVEQSTLAARLLEAEGRLDVVQNAVAEAGLRLSRVSTEYDSRSADLMAVRAELAARYEGLSTLRSARDDAREDARAALLNAYMGGGTSQPTVAFSATAVAELSVGIAYLEVLGEYRDEAAFRYADLVGLSEARHAEVRSIEEAIAEEVVVLDVTASEIDASRADLEVKQLELNAEYLEQKELLERVKAEIDEFEGALAAFEREEQSIKAMIREASRPAGTTPGSLARPVPGAITSGFGWRTHPILGDKRMHNGVDMSAGRGDRIQAAASGTVILASVKGGYGNTVMVDHGGGMVTLYAHQSRFAVTVGQNVTVGQTIGYIGSTGMSTGPHLHFEVRINGVPTNPMNYL